MAHAWRLPSKTTPTRPCPRRKVRGKKKRSPHGPKKNISVHLTFFFGNLGSLHQTLTGPLRGMFFPFIGRIEPRPSYGVKPWSCCVCWQHWKLASHIANLPEHRWGRKCLFGIQLFRYRWQGGHSHGLTT